MKIIIAEDHYMVRRGILRILQDGFPEAEIDHAENGKNLVEKVRTQDYDLIITDLSMPEMNGLQAIQEIRNFSQTPIIVLSMHTEVTFANFARSLGAQAFITKDSASVELVTQIRAILNL
ncbi:MAG: response regulator [Flavitalea sp.]